MALLTERALKRKPVAVIVIEAKRANVGSGKQDVDFEWFNDTTPGIAEEWMDGWAEFTKKDADTYTVLDDDDDPAMAYMTILIPDTSTLEVGRVDLSPDTKATQAWREETVADIAALFEKAEAPKAKAVVKARRKVVAKGTVKRGAVIDDDDEDEVEEAPKARRSVVRRVKRAEPEDEGDE